MARLKALREKTEAVSYAEVLKNALRLYEALIDEADHGGEVIIRRKQGDPAEINIFPGVAKAAVGARPSMPDRRFDH